MPSNPSSLWHLKVTFTPGNISLSGIPARFSRKKNTKMHSVIFQRFQQGRNISCFIFSFSHHTRKISRAIRCFCKSRDLHVQWELSFGTVFETLFDKSYVCKISKFLFRIFNNCSKLRDKEKKLYHKKTERSVNAHTINSWSAHTHTNFGTIVLWWFDWFQGALNWTCMMSRDVWLVFKA